MCKGILLTLILLLLDNLPGLVNYLQSNTTTINNNQYTKTYWPDHSVKKPFVLPTTRYNLFILFLGTQFIMANKPDWLTERSAAIPIFSDNGVIKVVLVTTKPKQKGNWIYPKGQVELGMTAADSAAKEAYEEAGVIGQVSPILLDEYRHEKWGGKICVKVYILEVHTILDNWKEMRDRDRQIVSLEDAINTVQANQKNALLKLKQQIGPHVQTQSQIQPNTPITNIKPNQLNREMRVNRNLVLLDVRELSERPISGILSHNEKHIPLNLVKDQVKTKITNRHANIVVYCEKGLRGESATRTLNELGYTNVSNLAGGIKAWKEAGLKPLYP